MDRPQFSEMLSERRRELGYSIGQASRVLRLREDVLVAFEEGNFNEMPKSGYAQGMLSSYARYLGLDAGVVVDAYLDELDARKHRPSRRGGRADARSMDAQGDSERGADVPRVPSRGLLPTSGGYAGDLGSFATTRVTTRASDVAEDGEAYPQGRPYTGKAPAYSSRGERRGAGNDISTLSLDYSQYDDDLLMGRDAMPYEAASSSQGRRRMPRDARAGRPQVSRRSTQQPHRQRRRNGQKDTRGRGGSGRRQGSANNRPLIIIGVVVLVFVVVMVLSIHSCVSQTANPTRTVPITTAQQSDANKNATAKSQEVSKENSGSTSSAQTTNSSKLGTGSAAGTTSAGASGTDQSGTSASDVSVSVSVADGAVAWLEISCDGKSEVAETVTGPWQKSFHVRDAITIQSGDTGAVTVLQDGKQVQFDSMASGIGTIRIQGPGRQVGSTTSTKTDAQDGSTSIEDGMSSQTDSAKMGNGSSEAGLSSETGLNESGQSQYGDDSLGSEYYGTYTESGY